MVKNSNIRSIFKIFKIFKILKTSVCGRIDSKTRGNKASAALAAFIGFFTAVQPLLWADPPPSIEAAESAAAAAAASAAAAAASAAAAAEQAVFSRPVRRKTAPILERLGNGGDIAGAEIPSQIGGHDNPSTRRYIEQYTTKSGKLWLNNIMTNAEPYLAFIRREIDMRNLPAELLYVPVVESGFVSNAKSSAGATGLWQFMRNSMLPFDMNATDWMDERMDFWKSTVGALEKLQENYRALGDWALALAAYNMGLGGMQRIIRQAGGIKDYWELSEKNYFKAETSAYMPKLLAVSHILTHPRQFGLPVLWVKDPQWIRINVGRTVDLRVVAEHAGIDEQILINANQELFYTVTPPDANYYLKVRAEDADKVAAVLERNDIILIKYHIYTVKSGDTLSALARHYGVTVTHIMEHNKGVQPQTLQIGKRLIIPAYKDVGPYPGAVMNAPLPTDFTGTHTVRQGETLWSIARSYNVRPEALAMINNMNLQDTLSIGRALKVPIKEE
ncbi:MAG: LysM peptidoglycan-binding domain-containing protein [Treponema sp.]|jgi:membrane-bound lytic murein transglycosylase D|nr:LysM peptidoglycan-binding domain-containing protein [Treponema sp.]